MTGIPMVCMVCGTPFIEKGIDLQGTGTAVMEGIESRCPNCHGPARAMDGIYSYSGPEPPPPPAPDKPIKVRDVAAALAVPDATPKDYAKLAELLRGAQQLGLSGPHVAGAIRTKTPVFGALADILQKDPAGWVSVLISVLALIVALHPPTPEPPPAPQVTVVVEQPTPDQIQGWIEQAVAQQAAKDAQDKPKHHR